MMSRRKSPRWGGALFASVILLVMGAQPTSGRAAEIAWERTNPFQGCLAASLDKWLEAQVDLLTNEDPATWRTDDRSVATWTVEALAACKAKTGGGDEATEATFTKYMAQWRRHVYELVEAVRQKGKPD
jgi:hypothetical protein